MNIYKEYIYIYIYIPKWGTILRDRPSLLWIFTIIIIILSILFDGLTRVNQIFPSQCVLFVFSSLSIVICLKMCLKIDNLIRIIRI